MSSNVVVVLTIFACLLTVISVVGAIMYIKASRRKVIEEFLSSTGAECSVIQHWLSLQRTVVVDGKTWRVVAIDHFGGFGRWEMRYYKGVSGQLAFEIARYVNRYFLDNRSEGVDNWIWKINKKVNGNGK